MNSSIYWLSIMDNVHNAGGPMAGLGLTFGAIGLFIGGVVRYKEEEEVPGKMIMRFACCLLAVGSMGIFMSIFVPTKRDIIESYIIIEGQHIVNAENADKMIERADEVLERVLGKIEDRLPTKPKKGAE